jgi:hypothetical protein
MGQARNAYTSLVGKCLEILPLAKPRRRRVDGRIKDGS